MKNKQKGVGMVEVLVALILLSIAVLGYVALQINAIAASQEAGKNTQAINIARDLSERMRVNRDGLEFYKSPAAPTDPNTPPPTPPNCVTAFCTSETMAQYDYRQVATKAMNLGLSLDVLNCQGANTLKRKCIYVSWEGTTPTNGTQAPHCTNGVAYLPEARCVIVEVYNHDE